MSAAIEPNTLFDETRWTEVHRAAHGDAAQQKVALNSLADYYLKRLRVVAKKRGLSPEHVEDGVMVTLASVFEPKKLARVDRAKGRLRDYLTTALENWNLARIRHERRGCRDVRKTQPLDSTRQESLVEAETSLIEEMDRSRAIDCLEEVRKTLKGSRQSGPEADLFNTQWLEIMGWGDGTQAEQAAHHNIEAATYRKQLAALKRRTQRLFSELVAKGVMNPADAPEEVNYLGRLAQRHWTPGLDQ